jgi:hypothetical protein
MAKDQKKSIPENEIYFQAETDNLGVLVTTLPRSITFGEQSVERER